MTKLKNPPRKQAKTLFLHRKTKRKGVVATEGNESEHPFEKETFDPVLTFAISMWANIHQTTVENICSAQEKQRRGYNRRHQVPNKVKVGQKVLLKNQRRKDLIRYQIRTFAP